MFKNRVEVTLFVGLVIAICIGLFISIQEEEKKALRDKANSIKFFQETSLKWENAKKNPNFHYELMDHVVDATGDVYQEWGVSIFAQNNPNISVIRMSPYNFFMDISEFDCYSKSVDCKITMIFDHKPELAWEIEINNEPDSNLKSITYNSPEHNDLSDEFIVEKVFNSSHIELVVERNGYPTVNLNYLTAGIMNPNDYNFYGEFNFY